jgi:predicted glycogen debranching enzyme
MIRFDQEECRDFERAVRREWLETNGLGGFASSSIINLHTRRYHGLLVAAMRPPLGRIVLLSKLEETLVIGNQRFELSSNKYSGNVTHPEGYKHQIEFRLDPFPIFTYLIGNIRIEKSVFMPYGENTIVIQYRFQISDFKSSETILESSSAPHLSSLYFEVRPLVTARDYHSLHRKSADHIPAVNCESNLLRVKYDESSPALYLSHDADEQIVFNDWYYNFEFEIEQERGFDFTEDLFCPAVLKTDLSTESQLNLIASVSPQDITDSGRYRNAETERRKRIAANCFSSSVTISGDNSKLLSALHAAANQFIVARGEKKTVIAGYHWFGDWGRDTMIALPGLTLATRRFDVAREILLEFSRHISQGMIPNRFPDAGEHPEYNTVDATLWYFEAVRSFLQYTNDYEFVRVNLYGALRDIIAWHRRGTRYGIKVDEDALLRAGIEGVQLTWMDAKIGDWVVTPRTGKAVEIQALWYNALRVMEDLANRFGDDSINYGQMADEARVSFNQKFWNEDRECLYDVINKSERDVSVRPNQIFAISLTYPLIEGERARSVVRTVERELLTPYGLRTLATGDPQYRGHYTGDALSRDGSYHQGTVWAWLIGPFIAAYIKTSDDRQAARRQAALWLNYFREHLREAGLNQISEIFDGDPPHAPRGCIAQAWSVAEHLRVMVEDVYPRGE